MNDRQAAERIGGDIALLRYTPAAVVDRVAYPVERGLRRAIGRDSDGLYAAHRYSPGFRDRLDRPRRAWREAYERVHSANGRGRGDLAVRGIVASATRGLP